MCRNAQATVLIRIQNNHTLWYGFTNNTQCIVPANSILPLHHSWVYYQKVEHVYLSSCTSSKWNDSLKSLRLNGSIPPSWISFKSASYLLVTSTDFDTISSVSSIMTKNRQTYSNHFVYIKFAFIIFVNPVCWNMNKPRSYRQKVS